MSCDRVKLENEVEEDDEEQQEDEGGAQGAGQYQDEFGVPDAYGQEMDPNQMQYTEEELAQMQAYQE